MTHESVKLIRNVVDDWRTEAIQTGYLVEEGVDPRRLPWKAFCRENRLPEIIVRHYAGAFCVLFFFRGTELTLEDLRSMLAGNWHCLEDGIVFYDRSLDEAQKLAQELARALFFGALDRNVPFD